MNSFSHVPPGFRFHPTDEELVDYYLRKKIASKRIDLDVIKDVDLYKIEPWDLQELCRISAEEQNDWYFFSHKDKKYPTGTRTNRATKAGFWKATGRDKAIYKRHSLIGMRKTLVFYQGRAPNGQKSDWIMHEYRYETNENATSQEEGWVVCRVFKKRLTTVQKMSDYGSPCWYDDSQVSFMPELDSPGQISQPASFPSFRRHQPYNQYLQTNNNFSCKQELELKYTLPNHDTNFLNLPHLESPKLLPQSGTSASLVPNYGLYDYNRNNNDDDNNNNGSTLHSLAYTHVERMNQLQNMNPIFCNNNNVVNNDERGVDHMTTDWRIVDQLVASQLSHQDESKETYVDHNAATTSLQMGTEEMNLLLSNESKRAEFVPEYASTSTSSYPIDLWK